MFDSPLNENTHTIYAAKHFLSKSMGEEEFLAAMRLFTDVKRLLRKYHNDSTGFSNHQLLFNKIITIRNLFSTIPTVRMLFFYMDSFSYSTLKTTLIYLKMLPSYSVDIPEVQLDRIKLDDELISQIRQLNIPYLS
jgi:hypothetical protein